MPVTQTVAEKILREFVVRLEAYSSGGVAFTVYREVMDPDRMTPTDYQVVIRMSSNARQPALDRIGNPPAIAYDMMVTCYGQVMVSESDSEAVEGHGLEIAGRIVDAIVNGADWYKFGGDAINCQIGDMNVTGSTGYRGGEVSFLVTYRVQEGSPFTASA